MTIKALAPAVQDPLKTVNARWVDWVSVSFAILTIVSGIALA